MLKDRGYMRNALERAWAAGMKTLVFKETKPLPSYLVAFAVGPFEFVNAGVAGTRCGASCGR